MVLVGLLWEGGTVHGDKAGRHERVSHIGYRLDTKPTHDTKNHAGDDQKRNRDTHIEMRSARATLS